MKIEGERESENVQDRRGMSMGGMVGGGGVVMVLALVAYLLGMDPTQILQQGQQGGVEQGADGAAVAATPEEERAEKLVRVVLASTEDAWGKILPDEAGVEYGRPELILFRGQTNTSCGPGQAAMGPFYCPADRRVYIDLSFYQDLAEQMEAPGDFAQAYVIAHEVGHHVQNLLGISDQMHEAQGRVSKEEYNQLSVRLELQADFLAGVWAHHAQEMRGILEQGDLEEALRAANQIGDDTLQKKAQGRVVPAAFTHGTSEQRIRWFRKGYETGNLREMDTFKMPYRQL